MDVGSGVRAWQCQQINRKDFHGIPFLKEIHLSYFWNIIKSSSEYFECSIVRFPRNQPRKTDTSTREVPPCCNFCLTVPSGTWARASYASLLHQCALKTQFTSALPSLGSLDPSCWSWLCSPMSQGPSISPWKLQSQPLTNALGGPMQATKKAGQGYFSSLQVGLRAKELAQWDLDGSCYWNWPADASRRKAGGLGGCRRTSPGHR